MDLPDLVHPRNLSRMLRLPAVHFAVVGALLFGLAQRQPEVAAAGELQRLSVPPARLDLMRKAFAAEIGRWPTAEEETAIAERLVDEEILFRHAMALGLDRSEIPRRRLAQIAAFVAEDGALDGGLALSEAELARQAVDLGLHEGDTVVRRILIDAASRLIRAAVLSREPTEEAMERFLDEHRESFRQPDRWRITQLLVHPTRDDAEALLARLQRDGVGPDEAPALLQQPQRQPHLPALAERSLERRFGGRFTHSLADANVGEWLGPVRSRFGTHLVFVHERIPGTVPELAEVHQQVRARVRDQLAELWLAERLRQLRAGYTIDLEEAQRS